MIPRHLGPVVLEALADSPVVLLVGARQTGKSTLVQELVAKAHPARYVTLDDVVVLAAARADPAGFLGGLGERVALDEVQRAPELFLAIKAAVDRDRRPGRFLLTGSANVLLLPRLSESLVGRMEVLTLGPFSQGEMERQREGFVDALFARDDEWSAGLAALRAAEPEDRTAILGRAVRGGYPEAVSRPSPRRRAAWFGSYVTTIVQRDIRDLANIEGLTALPRLLTLVAARATGLLNYAELSRSSGLPQSTLKRYMALLEATFLIDLLPAWSSSRSKRVVRSPKLMMTDTGLMAHLLGVGEEVGPDDPVVGPLVEGFVAMELGKQATWSEGRPALFHFRPVTGQEVDLVLESPGRGVVGLEVKASATVGARDFGGLRTLAEHAGKLFRRGVVLYSGRETVPFGPQLEAVPISALWRMGQDR